MNNTWGNGLSFSSEKCERLTSGGNQIWYRFKQSLSEHLSCNPNRSGGQFHFKAKQYTAARNREMNENISANMNVVSAGLQVCKMKSAAQSFEGLISLLSFCGTVVGNIGHGRLVKLKR